MINVYKLKNSRIKIRIAEKWITTNDELSEYHALFNRAKFRIRIRMYTCRIEMKGIKIKTANSKLGMKKIYIKTTLYELKPLPLQRFQSLDSM